MTSKTSSSTAMSSVVNPYHEINIKEFSAVFSSKHSLPQPELLPRHQGSLEWTVTAFECLPWVNVCFGSDDATAVYLAIMAHQLFVSAQAHQRAECTDACGVVSTSCTFALFGLGHDLEKWHSCKQENATPYETQDLPTLTCSLVVTQRCKLRVFSRQQSPHFCLRSYER